MQKSSMRKNLLIVMGLYGVSLLAASGCPTSNEQAAPATSREMVPVAIKAPESTAEPNGEEDQAVSETVEQAAPSDHGSTKNGEEKLTPEQRNGKFFVGWSKPKLAILISGAQDGYLEPCGCAGLENQKGGLARRHSLVKQLREQGWPLLAIDLGNFVRRFGKQAELQFAMSVEALKTIGYSAATFGPSDLRLSAGEVAAAVAGAEPGESLFVSANVSVFGLTPKIQVVEKDGTKIGITAVMSDSYREKVNNSEIEFESAKEALVEVVDELAYADIRILLVQGSRKEAIELAKQFPQFEYVVTAEGGDEPPYMPESIEGTDAKLIEVGHKGMYCIVLGFYDDPEQPVRYQKVAIDARFPDAPEMKQLMATYQEQLRDLGWAGLGIRALPHPRTQVGIEGSGQFVGGESCADCHTKAWEVWENSPHAHATESLLNADPPRQFDPECISCHATGWNPQEYFPYLTGFEDLKSTPHLTANSCENCHGPGGAHVAAENGDDEALRDAQRELMKVSYEQAKADLCIKCHDLDNSPDYHFDTYWPEVEHKGKD